MKQYKLTALVLLMALCLMACAAAEEEPVRYRSGDFEYVLLENGTAEIADYFGHANHLTVPDKLDGYRVTGIGDSAFYDCDSLTSITLPDGLTCIGEDAFWCCFALTEITLPESVTSIGGYAFQDCGALTSITLPDSVVHVGANPFWNCSKLTDIRVSTSHPVLEVIDGVLFDKTEKKLICYPCAFSASSYAVPDGILSIGESAFYWCPSLTSITLPESLTSIGDTAFSSCNSLTSITLPDSLTSIGAGAFWYCSKLTDIRVSTGHPVLEVIDGVLFDKTEKKLICYPCAFSASSYAVPDGILSIGESAFYNCRFLTSITLPDSLTSIGDGAFYSCFSLTGITLPDSVTSIGDTAFGYCVSLTNITLPDSLTSIGDTAFYWCDSLTSITLPDSLTSIGDYAFYWCDSLTSITLPDSLTSIGDGAFLDCSDQLTFFVPVNSFASQWCKAEELQYQYVSQTGAVERISGDYRYFALPDGTAQIIEYTGTAQQLTIPAELDGWRVTGVAGGAFGGCTALVSVTLPDGVTVSDGNPFRGCGNLTDLWVSPDHPALAVMGGVLFDKAEKKLICCPAGLTAERYNVPEGIRIIGSGAFDGCSALESVTLPESITAIAEDAFTGCSAQMVCTVDRGSFAAQWLADRQLRYTYPDADSWLLE